MCTSRTSRGRLQVQGPLPSPSGISFHAPAQLDMSRQSCCTCTSACLCSAGVDGLFSEYARVGRRSWCSIMTCDFPSNSVILRSIIPSITPSTEPRRTSPAHNIAARSAIVYRKRYSPLLSMSGQKKRKKRKQCLTMEHQRFRRARR